MTEPRIRTEQAYGFGATGFELHEVTCGDLIGAMRAGLELAWGPRLATVTAVDLVAETISLRFAATFFQVHDGVMWLAEDDMRGTVTMTEVDRTETNEAITRERMQ